MLRNLTRSRKLYKTALNISWMCFLLICFSPGNIKGAQEEAYTHLSEVMDRYHEAFDVYTDQDSGGNHFYPTGWMGDSSSLDFDSVWTTGCHEGKSCIKITFTSTGSNWAGIYWQNPENNWGTVPNGGYDLTGATEISFWAKGASGGERVEFFVGGITGPYSDSFAKTSIIKNLSGSWQEITINLSSKNLSYVIGGFGFTINSADNPSGATFYIDNIRYDKTRLDEPRFVLSYETLNYGDPDKWLTNACFVYDNALALLSFLARGTPDDLSRAEIIADALEYAINNDPYYEDGRLRNAYRSGDFSDHMTGKVRLPGRWDFSEGEWVEDAFHLSTHTGNIAWAMIALLSYYEKDADSKYLNAAIDLGEWIVNETKISDDCEGGYTGGYEGIEPNATKVAWKSTEHNIDVYVAFMRLYQVTGDAQWKTHALYAKSFVKSMWNSVDHHFWTGSTNETCTINTQSIPVDIQAWSVLTFNRYGTALTWAESNCKLEIDDFIGFDFNTDRDGIWFEGTAQMGVAYQNWNLQSEADECLSELRRAQTSATNANDKGIVAASRDGVTTGFEWLYYNRLHIGATAWYIFAERSFNPYWCSEAKRKFNFPHLILFLLSN